jgi:hypothetical protein
LAVDLRSRRYAFRGLAREPPYSFAPAGSHSARSSRRSQAPSASINRFQNQQSPLTQPKIKNENIIITLKQENI